MPDPAPENETVPTNPVSAGVWGLRWASKLTPIQILSVAFCLLMALTVAAVVMMYYDSRQDKQTDKIRAEEREDQIRKDAIAEREKNRQHEISVIQNMQRHCADIDKQHRAETKEWRDKAEIHMKDATAIMNKITDSMNSTNAAITKFSASVDALNKKPPPIME